MRILVAIVLALLFVTAPTLSLIDIHFDISLIKENLDAIKSFEKWQFIVIIFIFALVWFVTFVLSIKENSYKLHDWAGIIGVFLSCISVALMGATQEFSFFVLLLTSGYLCVYCISVPIYFWFKNSLRDSAWEYAFLIVVVGSTFIYIIDGFASIMINEFFGFNSKYFSFTKPVAMFLILTPFVALFSFVGILLITLFETNQNTESSSTTVDDEKKVVTLSETNKSTEVSPSIGNNEKEVIGDLSLYSKYFNFFYRVTSLMACYVLLIISLYLGNSSSSVLESVSAKFDFDPKASCILDIKYDGFIVLDSAYSKVLTYSKDKDYENKYKVIICKLIEG
jgi:hypothetical protein